MATRKDVADLAGVSTATVSYYINNSGYVSKEKRERIEAAIKACDYRPNLIAKSLKMKDSKQLVFLCNEIRNPFHAQLAYGATNIAYEKGYLTLFCNVIDDEEYIKKICSYQVSGVLIATTKVREDIINYIAALNIPVVVLEDREWKNLDSRVSKIVIEYKSIIHQLLRHVIENGAKRIAYISATSNKTPEKMDGKTQAFFKIVKEENIEFDEKFLISGVASAADAYEYVTKCYSAMVEKPDAYICSNDAVATGVLRAVYDMGLRVPQDVIITGFDNTINSKVVIPSLTSVDISMDKLSKIAIEMLLDKSSNKVEVRDYIVTPRLIVRESTRKEK